MRSIVSLTVNLVAVLERCVVGSRVEGALVAAVAAAAAVSHTSGCPTQYGVVAMWRLDESSGAQAKDSTGSNHGTLTNGASFGATYKDGMTAASFDGVDDYVEIPHRAVYLLDEGTVSLSRTVLEGLQHV